MKNWAVIATFLAGCPCFAQTAREFYNELYAAGGLDQIISEHVCFDEKPELQTFFIFTNSKRIREVMIADGAFSKAPKTLQAQLNKDLMFFRGYDKGVPLSSEDTYTLENGSWVSDKFMIEKTPSRIRFNITLETMRYKRSVELLNPDGSINSVIARYGRCEKVSPEVRQRGK